MQTTRPASIAALLLAASLLLSGCGSGGTEPTASPRSSGEPVFASEEEALAAAEEVFAAFVRMSDTVLQEGGRDPERIAPFVTEAFLAEELASLKEATQTGQRQIGDSRFDKFALQQTIQDHSKAVVIVNVCLDFTSITILDAQANVVSTATTPMAMELAFETLGNKPSLRLSEMEPWSDTDYC